MKLSKLPSWLRRGIIGAGCGLIIYAFYFLLQWYLSSIDACFIGPGICYSLYNIMMIIFAIPVIFIPGYPEIISSFTQTYYPFMLIVAIPYVIWGALIGLITDLIIRYRKRKKK